MQATSSTTILIPRCRSGPVAPGGARLRVRGVDDGVLDRHVRHGTKAYSEAPTASRVLRTFLLCSPGCPPTVTPTD